VATAADLVREACTLLASYLPRLERLAPEPDVAAPAAPGMAARPPAAPLPGNAAALFALTSVHATARQLEGVLKYAAGARRGGPLAVRGGSDANTLAALDAIGALAEIADDDLYRLVIAELEQRLDEARSVAAIDEAQRWRHLRGRACPYCGCLVTLKVALDARGRPTGHVECFAGARADGGRCLDGNGLRPVAAMGTDERGRPVLAWADGRVETVPDLEELCASSALMWAAIRTPTRSGMRCCP